MRYPVLHDNIITYLLTKNRYDFFIENFILCILWSIVFNTSGILSTYCTDSYVKINSLHNLHKPYIFEIFIVLLFIFRGCQRAGNYKWTNLFFRCSVESWSYIHRKQNSNHWHMKEKNAKLIANFYKRIIIMKIIYILHT